MAAGCYSFRFWASAVQLAEPMKPSSSCKRQSPTATPSVEARLAALDYAGALGTLALLREPVDAFFDAVMVNADEAALRRNRLALLGGLHRLMNRVADLSKLAA